MKLATWNVNSLNVRLAHVLEFLAAQKPDVLCLQETKLEDAKFPIAEITGADIRRCFPGKKLTTRRYAFAALAPRGDDGDRRFEDPQKRVISAVVNGIRIVCVYIPNGESVESVKYGYKLDWLGRLNACMKEEMTRYPRLAVLGDYNIAPEDRDVHDPKFWAGKVLFSEPEKTAFRDMVALGLQDSFRLFEQPEKSYSWWDYRMNGFKQTWGCASITSCSLRSWQRSARVVR